MRILPSFPVTHGARRVAVFALSGVYFFQAVVGAYAGETRFWQDRRAALRRQDTPSPLLFAQVQGQALLWPEASVLPKAVLPPTKSERYAWLCDAAAPYGTVPELFVSPRPDAPLIVHIQDAHEVEEAQTNTAGLIADLSEKHGVRLVGLEGAVGAFDLENLRSPGQSEVVRGLAMAFTRLGYLGGAELAAITAARPPLLWGIENPDLYRANLVALRASSPRQGPLNPVLSGLQAASAAAERNVSAPLVEFASHQRDYAAQVRTLAEHVQYLWRLLPGMGSRFPNAWTLRRALDAERKIDFALVEKDRRALVEALAGRLSPKAMEELAKRSVDCRLGRVGFGEYYGYLNRLALGHGITLSAFRSLPAYADYVRLAESVQREKLLAELTALADLAGASLAKTEIDKRWLAAQKDLGLLTKLRNRAMTPAAWEEYRSRRDEILRLPKTLGALAGIPLANISPDTVAPFEAFCRLASARNEYLVRNILEKMKVEGTKTGVLVAGGFHTRGLVQLLREAGVSYAVVTPRLTEVPKVSMDIFARDPLPLEKRVGGEIISLAYARLTQIDPTVKGAEPGALRRAAKLALIFAAVLSTTAGPLPAAPIPSLIHQEVQVDDPRVRAVRWTSPAGANPLQFDVVTAPTSVAKENPAVLGPSPILQFSADNQAVAVGRLPAATRETVGPWVGAARYFATRRNLTRAAFWLLAGIGAMVCPDLYHLTLASLQDPSALFLAAGVTAMPLNKTGTTPPMNWREISKEYLTKKYARLKGARPKAVVQDLFRADLDLESMEDAPAKRAPPATAAEIFNELEGDIRALQAGMAEIMPDAENDILDAIAEFLFQFPRPGADISLDHLKEILGNSHNPARAELIAYFKDRFDPDQDEGLRVARSKHHLSNIATLLGPSERKIDPLTQEVFAAAISFVGSVEKTNFFCPGRVQLAFSIIPKDFPGFASDRFPEPPYRVIFVHVPYGGFGFHVRMEDIARGGLREISPADSRRMLPEDYDLAVTMGLKNLDIDTGGSKGIVYCDEVSKQVAVETGYLMGLLDFMTPSDFIVGAPGTKIKPDELYLGPDTGTGYLPNLAKTLARMRGPHKTPYKYWRAFMTGGDFPALGGISHGRNNLIKRDKDAGNHVNSIGVVAHIMRNMHALGVDPVNGSYSVAIWGAPAGDVAGGSLLHLLRISPGARIRAIVDHTGVVFDPQGIDPDALLDLYEENGSAANFRGPLGEGAVSIAWSGGPFELNSETLRHMNARVLDPLVNKAVTAENVIVLERVDGIPSRVRILNPQFFWSEISHFLIPADVFIPADRQHDRITSANAHLLLDPSGNPIVRTIVCGANNWVSNGANAMLRRMNIYPTPDFVANKWGVNVSHRVEVAFALLFSEAEGTKPLAEYFEIMLNLFYRETQREHFAIWRASEQESATGGEPAIEMAKEIRRLTEMIYRSDDFDFGGSGVWTWAREEFPLASGRLLPMGFLRARWKLGAARLRRTAAQTLAKNIVWNAGTEFTRRGAREFDCSEIDVVAAYARAATAPLGVPNVPPGRTFQEIVDAELKVDQPFVDMTAEIGELEKTLAARIVKILSEKRPPRPSRAQPAPKPLSGPRFSDARRDFENRLRDARNRFDLQNALDIFREEVWSEPGSVASRSRLFCQGVDEVVRRLLTMHGLADRHSIAVAAAGAYGRRELGPTSVVEVVVPSQGVEDEFGSGFDRIFAQFQSDFIFIFHQDEAHHPQLLSRPLVSIGPVRVFQGLVDARCIAGNSQIFRDYQDTMDHRLGSEFSPESVARGLEESWRAAPHTDGIATWDRINFLAHLAQRADRSWLARHLPNHVWLALRGYLSRRNSRNARASFRRLVALAARERAADR